MQRVLAGNIFYAHQRRFRNICTHWNHWSQLWIICIACNFFTMKQLALLSWWPTNTNILAIGYGAFTCMSHASVSATLFVCGISKCTHKILIYSKPSILIIQSINLSLSVSVSLRLLSSFQFSITIWKLLCNKCSYAMLSLNFIVLWTKSWRLGLHLKQLHMESDREIEQEVRKCCADFLTFTQCVHFVHLNESDIRSFYDLMRRKWKAHHVIRPLYRILGVMRLCARLALFRNNKSSLSSLHLLYTEFMYISKMMWRQTEFFTKIVFF